MDIVEMHERALDQTGRIVANVDPAQLDLPTPCSEWKVRELLNHMVAGNRILARVAEGEPNQRASSSEDVLGSDPAAAYRQGADELKRAWRQPGRLDQSYPMPMGMMPGPAVMRLRTVETVTHGWDLAKATGQIPQFDEDLVDVANATANPNRGISRPPNAPFVDPVDVSDDAPAIDRLAAAMGRRP